MPRAYEENEAYKGKKLAKRANAAWNDGNRDIKKILLRKYYNVPRLNEKD